MGGPPCWLQSKWANMYPMFYMFEGGRWAHLAVTQMQPYNILATLWRQCMRISKAFMASFHRLFPHDVINWLIVGKSTQTNLLFDYTKCSFAKTKKIQHSRSTATITAHALIFIEPMSKKCVSNAQMLQTAPHKKRL